MMEGIHDRMPTILTKDQEQMWIDNNLSAEDAVSIIQPYPSDLMMAYRVDSRVGKVSENDADLIVPIDDTPELIQGSLF
jgi:putative SOS response-associated peptidase YedK